MRSAVRLVSSVTRQKSGTRQENVLFEGYVEGEMKAMKGHYLLKRKTLRAVEAKIRTLRLQMRQQICPERAFVRRPLLHPTLRIRALIGLKELKGLSCNFHDLCVWAACFSALLCKDHLSRRAELT
jgi:hypothetical protein